MTQIATIPLSTVRAPIYSDPGRPAARWPRADIEACFDLPFMELLFRAQQVHREHFDASEVQLSTLLSIKTGGCSEDCGYRIAPQCSIHSGLAAQLPRGEADPLGGWCSGARCSR